MNVVEIEDAGRECQAREQADGCAARCAGSQPRRDKAIAGVSTNMPPFPTPWKTVLVAMGGIF